VPGSKEFISVRLDEGVESGASKGSRFGTPFAFELRQALARICLGTISQGRFDAATDCAARTQFGKD